MIFSLVVASCTGGDGAGSSTTLADEPTTTEQPPAEPVSLEQVLGEFRPVQDFLIHLDMATGSEQDLNSFYDEVLAESRAGAQTPQELAGGFRFTPVQSLSATVVDADGAALPSLSADYALLDPGPERLAAVQADLAGAVDALDPEDRAQWSEFLDQADDGQPGLLVEIVTADPSGGRVHVGPGDLAALDLTFVPSLAPGDQVTSTYLFGQTLPGDPDRERGMSAHELFAYRWDQGLISMLGGPDGVEIIVDPAVTLIDGSTIRPQEVKGFIEHAAYREGFNEGLAEADALQVGDEIEVDGARVWLGSPLSGEALGRVYAYVFPRSDRRGGALNPPIFEASWLRSFIATRRGLERCAEVAAKLAERNQPTGDAAVIATVAERGLEGLADDPATTGPDPTESSTPGETGGEPLSCSPPPATGQLPKLPPTGVAAGDVHVTTIDGAHSANQAVGEFLLFDNGTAEIQMRTAPWGDGEILQVSFPTAFAARLGEHSVSIHPDSEMWVDGEPVELERGENLVIGDAEVMQWPTGVAVVWPDGTLAEFRLFETRGMVIVTPSPAPATGLLGNNDSDPDNDFFTRSGEQLDADVKYDFERFYGTYVDSWRLTDDESHFHYREGETTATFTLEGFPTAYTGIDDLPADARTRAEAVCRGVGIDHDDVFEDCVFDVGATGDPTFATDAFIAQNALPEAAESGATVDRSETADGEAVNALTIADLTIELGPDPSTQMSNGPTTAWTCRSDAGVFSVSGRLFESQVLSYEYRIEYISPGNSRGLPERFILSVTRSGEDFARRQAADEPFSDSGLMVSMDENSLVVEGELAVSGPPVQGSDPGAAPADDPPLQPFTLIATCTE